MRLGTATVMTALVVASPCFAKGGGGGGQGPSPNDQRSNAMNPNNAAYQAATDNRANQLNPEHSAYWSSRGGGFDDYDSAPLPVADTALVRSSYSPSPPHEPSSGGGSRSTAARSTSPARSSSVGLRIISWLGGVALAIYLAMAGFVRSRRNY